MHLVDPEIGAQLVELAGSPEFGEVLLRHANDLCGAVEAFGYIVPDGKEPTAIVSQSLLRGSTARVSDYIDRYFRMDPAVHEMLDLPKKHGFAQHIEANKIAAHDYRRNCFTEPGFAEKLTFGWRGQTYIIVLSFYMPSSGGAAAQTALSGLANLGLAGMVGRHAPITREDLVETIERRLRRSFPALSAREIQVGARSLAGRTVGEIADELGIGEGSAKTYRYRINAKIGDNARETLLAEAFH